MRLVKEHNFTNRNDLLDAASRLAEFIHDFIDKGKPVPVINIIGSPKGGKSIFWDIVTSKLLEKGGVFLANKSERIKNNERLYETWHSLDSQNPLRIFLCNIRASDGNAVNLDVNTLRNDFKQFGDVVILSNAYQGFIPDNVNQLEINLTTAHKSPDQKFTGQLEYTCNF